MLSTIDYANGILNTIFVILSISIGLFMISRYVKHKNRNLILAGITWVILCEPWWAVSISFLLTITINTPLPMDIFFLIGFSLIPIAIMAWMRLMTNLIFRYKKKEVMLLFLVLSVTFEVLLFVFLFLDITLLGIPAGTFDVEYGLFMLIYLGYILIVVVVWSGTRFAYESIKKSDNRETKLKGKFLLLAFYSFVIGSLLSVGSAGNLFVLILAKSIVILSAIEFYFGFILPNPIKKLFLRQKE